MLNQQPSIGPLEIIIVICVIAYPYVFRILGLRIMRKQIDPYKLKEANPEQKHRWAVKLAAFEVAPILLLFIAGIILILIFLNDPNNPVGWLMMTIYCIIPSIAIFPLSVVWIEWRMGIKLRDFNKWDRNRQRNWLTKYWLFSDSYYMDKEEKERFWNEGYTTD